MKVATPLLFVAAAVVLSTTRTTTTTNIISVPFVVEAANHPNKQHKRINNKKQKQKKGNIVCVDVADFFYEIILALSTFPKTSDCTEAEDDEIAHFMQQQLNAAMKALPGTIKTNNKICSDPIKFRRRGLLSSSSSFPSSHSLSTSDVPPAEDGDILSTAGFNNSTHHDWIPVANHPVLSSLFGEDDRWTRHLYKENQRRHLLRKFIFAGGGRCRYCFYDNFDKRQLSSPVFDVPSGETGDGKGNKKGNDGHISVEQEGRDLLFYRHKSKIINRTKVADASLCDESTDIGLGGQDFENGKAEGWKNGKVTTMPSPFGHVMGPLRPGDSVSKVYTQIGEEVTEKNSNDEDYLDLVTGAYVVFDYWAIDIPDEYADGFLEDDPMFLYLNGIKIDLGLFSKAPDTYFEKRNGETSMDGDTFAGIVFYVSEENLPKNYGFGKEIDRKITVELEFPRILFDHKNSIDVSIFIKPNAKAKQYAIDDIGLRIQYIPCEVIGADNSPFEEFKSITERKLREQMGLDVAREFQTRAGHCLENKIPMVDIHLVEKANWKEARPRCT